MTDASFSEMARRYCQLIDERDTLPLAEFLTLMHLQTARLYAAALVLRDPERSDIDAPTLDGVWDTLYHDLQHRLGPLDLYTEVYDPYADDEPVTGSLADAMADVYVDLMTGLVLYDAGHTSDAVWEWHSSFEIHWSHHALDILRALHAYQLMQELDDSELPTSEPAK